jgi:hypothetical protein
MSSARIRMRLGFLAAARAARKVRRESLYWTGTKQ